MLNAFNLMMSKIFDYEMNISGNNIVMKPNLIAFLKMGFMNSKRLKGCIDDLITVDDHHYAYCVQNFHQDQDFEDFDAPALR